MTDPLLLPMVSVVVPTFRRPFLLARVLAALAAQTLAHRRYEILIVDDGRSAETMEIVDACERDHPGLTFLCLTPPTGAHGPAAARNTGWRAARASIIAFTDDDTVPRRDWLEAGCRAMQRGATAVWGRLVVPISATPSDYERMIQRMEQAPFLTANCFVRRQALAAVGGFDERFTRAWREDSDLWFSLLRQGGLVLSAPEAIVAHPVRAVKWGVSLRSQRNAFFDALLYKKHPTLYRERIERRPPLDYYAIVACGVLTLLAVAAHKPGAALVAAAAWGGITCAFLLRRLRGTAKTPSRVLELAITSIAIPWIAVAWRLAGAVRYRVLFA